MEGLLDPFDETPKYLDNIISCNFNTRLSFHSNLLFKELHSPPDLLIVNELLVLHLRRQL